MPAPILPRSLVSYIRRVSGWHQLALALLSVVVFLLSAAPLELQRRIVNDAIENGAVASILWLALAYAGVALAEGGVKLVLNIYRGWVSENAVRDLRRRILPLTERAGQRAGALAEGVEISIVLAEVEPIGGFVGISLSEPLLQGGILLAVFGYLAFLEPLMALLCIAVFSPQLLFVPLMQRAINRRAAERIGSLREVSGGIAGRAAHEGGARLDERVEQVFVLNMGIFKLKYSMNFLMNLMHHLGVATALAVGGWYAVLGRIEVGTVVAFISGLAKVNDPWGDVVNWFREMTVARMRYGLVTQALDWLAREEG